MCSIGLFLCQIVIGYGFDGCAVVGVETLDED